METVKERLHKLIDETPDDQFLDVVHSILQENFRKVSIWEQLTEQQKNRVFQAERSIGDPSREIEHAHMVNKNKRWLE